jgi:hypothetical protein
VSPYHRLYVETTNPIVWAVDEGDSSTALHFSEVITSRPGSTNSNLEADNDKEPKAWIEFYDAELKEENGIGYLEEE